MSKSYKHLRKVTKLRLRQSCGLCRRLVKRIEKCLENDVKCDNKMVVLLYRSISVKKICIVVAIAVATITNVIVSINTKRSEERRLP